MAAVEAAEAELSMTESSWGFDSALAHTKEFTIVWTEKLLFHMVFGRSVGPNGTFGRLKTGYKELLLPGELGPVHQYHSAPWLSALPSAVGPRQVGFGGAAWAQQLVKGSPLGSTVIPLLSAIYNYCVAKPAMVPLRDHSNRGVDATFITTLWLPGLWRSRTVASPYGVLVLILDGEEAFKRWFWRCQWPRTQDVCRRLLFEKPFEQTLGLYTMRGP